MKGDAFKQKEIKRKSFFDCCRSENFEKASDLIKVFHTAEFQSSMVMYLYKMHSNVLTTDKKGNLPLHSNPG